METYCCQYATDSAEIKDRWELTMTRGKSQAVLEMLDPCQNLPGVEVWTTLGTTMRELKPEPTEEPETSFQSSWATSTQSTWFQQLFKKLTNSTILARGKC